MEKTHCWVEIPSDSDFTVHNLPLGVYSTTDNDQRRLGVAIGNHILDLHQVAQTKVLEEFQLNDEILVNPFLNDYIALGKPLTNKVRTRLQQWLTTADNSWEDQMHLFCLQSEAKMHLPLRVGDYTDFYSSIEHATNVGRMFRDPENALLPNWRHLPVGYHGRASSIIESGIPVRRPHGQTKPAEGPPVFGPSKRLDFELEMAFVIGKNSPLGESVSTAQAEDHIFGMVLFNDWSARDIQKWEYVPLGPFLAKNFASSISPWVVPLEALERFRVQGPTQDPQVLPYLQYQGPRNYDINLQVSLQPENGEESVICRSNFKYMYWNMTQQLAHHTVGGCNVKVGDLMASGTISGQEPGSFGSMLELSWGGKQPISLKDGATRTFVEDHDTIIMKGSAESGGMRIGFGEVRTKVLPAL